MTRPRSFLNTPLEGKLSTRSVVLIFCLSFTLSYLLFTGESASSTSGPLPPSALTFDGSLYPPPPASLRSASASSGDINAIPFRSQPLVRKAPRAEVVPPAQLLVQPAPLPAAGVVGGGVAPPPPPPYCPSQQGVYRGVVDPASVVPYLGLVPGVLGGGEGGRGGGLGAATLPHAHHPNPTCPRYLLVNQNHDAGGGHRLRQWSTSLWLAMALSHSPTSSSLFTPTSPLPAFAHTSLDQGVGPHGGYPGMDELLGLGVGEGALQVVGKGCCGDGELEPWLAAKGISLVPLPRENIQAYTPNAAALALWSGIMAQHTGCNVAFLIPRDHWAADHGTLTRNASVWKFAMAAALAAEATIGNTVAGGGGGGVVSQQQQKQQQASPLPRPHPRILSPPSQWPPHAIHIGLHFRVNDGLLVSDGDLTSVVKLTLLPALAAALANATDAGGPGAGAALAATPVHLHVFSESESPTTEAPLLLGLNGTPIPLTSLAGPGGNVHLRVFHYGPGQASSLDTIHALSQCDVFVGCVSSLSWAVAQFSSRPYPLMQRWGGDYAWCVTGGLCCEGGGCEVNGGARDGLQAHLDKLARMAACGALNERSWERQTLEQLTTISG